MTLAFLVALGSSGSEVQKQSLDGVWKSEGYGMVFGIQGTTLKSFEVTATTCVLGDAAQRDNTSIARPRGHIQGHSDGQGARDTQPVNGPLDGILRVVMNKRFTNIVRTTYVLGITR